MTIALKMRCLLPRENASFFSAVCLFEYECHNGGRQHSFKLLAALSSTSKLTAGCTSPSFSVVVHLRILFHGVVPVSWASENRADFLFMW